MKTTTISPPALINRDDVMLSTIVAAKNKITIAENIENNFKKK